MTVEQVIAQVAARWPHPYGAEALYPFLMQLENLVRVEIQGIQPRETMEMPQLLVVPSPYDQMYVHFTAAMIAQMDGEYDRYNAEMALFQTLWDGFSKQYRRHRLPPAGPQVHGYA